jgi:nitroreductase
MAEPAHRQSPVSGRSEAPPVDPTAVDRAYQFYRARRHAKIEHRRATRWAHARFWVFLGMLVLAVLVVGVTVWGEITKLFGL